MGAPAQKDVYVLPAAPPNVGRPAPPKGQPPKGLVTQKADAEMPWAISNQRGAGADDTELAACVPALPPNGLAKSSAASHRHDNDDVGDDTQNEAVDQQVSTVVETGTGGSSLNSIPEGEGISE